MNVIDSRKIKYYKIALTCIKVIRLLQIFILNNFK